MHLNEEIFAIKLYELEQQYGKLQSRLRICGQADHEKLLQELQKAKDAYREQALLLEKSVETGRSPAVSALAKAQLEYRRKTEDLLREHMDAYVGSELGGEKEAAAEAAALYAEYAIDFATQSMQYALIAALRAMDLQMQSKETKGEDEICRK